MPALFYPETPSDPVILYRQWIALMLLSSCVLFRYVYQPYKGDSSEGQWRREWEGGFATRAGGRGRGGTSGAVAVLVLARDDAVTRRLLLLCFPSQYLP